MISIRPGYKIPSPCVLCVQALPLLTDRSVLLYRLEQAPVLEDRDVGSEADQVQAVGDPGSACGIGLCLRLSALDLLEHALIALPNRPQDELGYLSRELPTFVA